MEKTESTEVDEELGGCYQLRRGGQLTTLDLAANANVLAPRDSVVNLKTGNQNDASVPERSCLMVDRCRRSDRSETSVQRSRDADTCERLNVWGPGRTIT